jgi:hypothetical protein
MNDSHTHTHILGFLLIINFRGKWPFSCEISDSHGGGCVVFVDVDRRFRGAYAPTSTRLRGSIT